MHKKNSSKLKIGFQGWFLTKPFTGIGRHSAGLIMELQKLKNVELFVVVPSALSAAQMRAFNLKTSQVKVIKLRKWLPNAGLRKWAWEAQQVPAAFTGKNLDWQYYPYPCPLPKTSTQKRAMTVHDMILWEDARYQGNSIKQKYYREAKRSLIYADHLFTVSKTTHHELGIPAATVLPNAVIQVTTKKSAKKNKDSSKEKTEDLVYFGGYELRKRVPLLAKRFMELYKKDPSYRLLLVGEPQQKSALYPEVPVHPAILKLGNKSDAELFTLLKSAFAFVHASDSEGFNLPLLEAMHVGTPAIVTDLEINREVSKGAAIFWDPSKKDSLIAIMKTLSTKSKRKTLIEREKKMAKTYSWKNSAQIFIKALKNK